MYSLYKNEYRIFKLVQNNHKKGTKVEQRKIEEMNQNCAIIHIYMEVLQGKCLRSDLKQAKTSFLFPFFCKIREQEGRAGLP
jgi:hypothetical protein